MVGIIASAAGRSSIGDQQSCIRFQCESFNVRDFGQPGLWPFAKDKTTAASSRISDHGCLPDNTCKDISMGLASESNELSWRATQPKEYISVVVVRLNIFSGSTCLGAIWRKAPGRAVDLWRYANASGIFPTKEAYPKSAKRAV